MKKERKMKKVLFPILALVLAVALALPMAAVAGAQPVYIETIYLVDTLSLTADNGSPIYTVDLVDGEPNKANLTHFVDMPDNARYDTVAALACSPDGGTLYVIDRDTTWLAKYDIATTTWTEVGSTGLNTCVQLVCSGDGTLYAASNATDSLYTVDTITAATTLLGVIKEGSTIVNVQGADIVFAADGTLYLWTDGGKRGLYTLSLPPSGLVVSATWLGSDVPTFTGLAIRAGGAGDLLGSNTTNNRIEQLSRSDGSIVKSYEMYLGVNLYAYEWGDMTVGELAVEEEPEITVEKDYRYTNVAFERDNDRDGLFNEDPSEQVDNDLDGFFSEDPIDGIDNDLDGLTDEDPEEVEVDNDLDGSFSEDPVDFPGGTDLGDLLPTDNGNYQLEAVIHPKTGKVKSYNPGQYYAVSTVTVLSDVDTLTIVEDWSDCAVISTLNPKKGGGRVVIVQVGPGDDVAYQILDADSDEVTVDNDNHTATAVLGPVSAGTTILMYVKFGPGLKGEVWNPPNGYYGPFINFNGASTAEIPVDVPEDWEAAGEDWIVASANLIVVDEY